MSGNTVELDIDVDGATRALDRIQDSVPDAGRSAVRQLTVLAEGAMKREAPEGAGRQAHLRDTIRTEFDRGGLQGLVRPQKKVSDGIPLVEILVNGASWDPDSPPPLAPLQEWTAAKWGDGSVEAAAILRNHLVEEGMDPNPFVARSIRDWQDQVEDIAGRAVRDELGVD
jgi:hypothetical protein